MPSSVEFLQYITEQLSDTEEVTLRPMMGEYIIYYRGRIAGGIYDNRLLVKPVKAAIEMTDNPVYDFPIRAQSRCWLSGKRTIKNIWLSCFAQCTTSCPS